MAESGSWASIKENGLFSTSALLDRFKITGDRRQDLETKQRKESVVIGHFPSGPAMIRDQIPLNEGALGKVVDGMTKREYYKLLNGKTFFWSRKERLERLLNGKQYRDRVHDVLTIDTEILVRKHLTDIWLSPINSGAFYGSGRRGIQTFKRIEDYPFEELRKTKKEDAVVEVAIDYSVKDIVEMTLRVENWKGGRPTGLIWKRS